MAHAIEKLLQRDRVIVFGGLIAITFLAWIFTVSLSNRMTGMDINNGPTMEMTAAQITMPNVQAWRIEDIFFNVIMWTVMMIAMMTPSVTPMVLTYAGLNRRKNTNETSISTTIFFLLGYLIVWSLFSIGATLLQWSFHSAGLLSTETIRVTPSIGGSILIFSGLYQFTSWKYTCLSSCRSPISFLTTEWRDGIRGALVMGLRHGIYCLGCCWQLMLLLFVIGVMNLIWVAAIAGFVLIEKLTPSGKWISQLTGLFAIGWGVWLLFQGFGM